MTRRMWIIVAGVLGAAAAAWVAFGFFGVQALWIDTTVDEAFPTTVAQPMATSAPPTLAPTMAPTQAPTAVAAAPTLRPATATPAPTIVPTPSEPVLIATGQFHAAFHTGSGDALIYRQPDGSYVLRFENFDIENGPDLYVYVVATNDSTDADTVLNAGFLDLGKLKGNQGNQNYVLPAEFDPQVHRSITIWCRRFTVNFVTAPLQ